LVLGAGCRAEVVGPVVRFVAVDVVRFRRQEPVDVKENELGAVIVLPLDRDPPAPVMLIEATGGLAEPDAPAVNVPVEDPGVAVQMEKLLNLFLRNHRGEEYAREEGKLGPFKPEMGGIGVFSRRFRAFPPRGRGARYRVRTCDPYRVKVVLYH
jgi:hypothetical protein